MQLQSPALDDGTFPVRYGRDGDNVSPPIRWSGLPETAEEVVVLLEGITPSTREPFVWWCAYGLSPDLGGLQEGFRHASEPEGARQARNDLGNVGYDGPLGTAGRDVKLRLTVLAVDAPIELEAGADARAVLEEARRHEVDRAEITVSYERPRP